VGGWVGKVCVCVRVGVCKICACVRVYKRERQRESDFSARLFAQEMPSVAYVAVCCSVLQCVAVCGSVWQCVAVC